MDPDLHGKLRNLYAGAYRDPFERDGVNLAKVPTYMTKMLIFYLLLKYKKFEQMRFFRCQSGSKRFSGSMDVPEKSGEKQDYVFIHMFVDYCFCESYAFIV